MVLEKQAEEIKIKTPENGKYPPKGRSELGGVPDGTVDISRKKRTQPGAEKDDPIPGQKRNQLAAEDMTIRIKKNADSVSNPSPRSEERKSSGSDNPDHAENCGENNKENDIEKYDGSPEANRETQSQKIRHARIGNALTSGQTNHHQSQKKEPKPTRERQLPMVAQKTTASTGSTTPKIEQI
jgi:hypothetical protein